MKTMLRRLFCTLFVAAAPIVFAAPPHTGVEGRAFHNISYGFPHMIAPGIWIGIPSVQLPVATSFSILSAHNGREIARMQTDATGFFSLSLTPGKYILVPDTLVLNVFFNCTVSTDPIEFEVKAKQFTFQGIFYFSQGPPCVISAMPAAGGQ